eukprot:733795-Amphidinium_carterae.1
MSLAVWLKPCSRKDGGWSHDSACEMYCPQENHGFLMYARLFLLACLVESAASQAAEDAACPCTDPFSDEALLSQVSSGDCLETASGECLPLDYGSSCFEWDAATEPCLDSEEPLSAPWCFSAWCYVDPEKCERPHEFSAAWNLSSPFAFSYATCGSLDTYTSVDHVATLQSRKLRITYPGSAGSGYTVLQGTDGVWTGSFVEFSREIWQELGITPKVLALSNVSQQRFPYSSFSACVHDVALNKTDICIGNVWDLPDRLVMAPFTGH